MSKKNEVATTILPLNAGLTADREPELDGSGLGLEGIDARDILIPRLQMIQAMSKKAQAGDAIPGQFVNSVNGEVIGGFTDGKGVGINKISFIPIAVWKSWFISEKVPGSQKFEFSEELRMDATNANLPREERVGNVDIQRDASINFFVLLSDEIADERAFPYLLSFRRTSFKAGQVIGSELSRVRAARMIANKPKIDLWHLNFELGVEKRSNDKGTFMVSTVRIRPKPDSATTAEQAALCKYWHGVVGSANVKVAEEDEHEAAPAPSTGGAYAPPENSDFDV